jgi:hypothetical protein
VMHGKSSPVYYDEELGKALFDGLPKYDWFLNHWISQILFWLWYVLFYWSHIHIAYYSGHAY